jgi:hypothetical protein
MIFVGHLTHPKSQYAMDDFLQFLGNTETKYRQFSERQILSFGINDNPETDPYQGLIEIALSEIYFILIKIIWALKRQKFWKITTQIRNFKYLALVISSGFQILNKEYVVRKQISNLRLRNITSNHMKLLEKGLASNSNLIIIFEDDLDFRNNHEEFFQVLEYMESVPEPLFFMNVSDSYNVSELRVPHLIGDPEIRIRESKQDTCIFRSRMTFTNSTSGMIYSRKFAEAFLEELRRFQKSRSLRNIPVDWLLNLSLVGTRMNQAVSFHAIPGIFKQQAMFN